MEPQRQLGDCRAAPTPSRGDPEVGTHAGGTLLCLVHSQRLQGSDRFSCTLLGKPLWKQIGLEPGGGGKSQSPWGEPGSSPLSEDPSLVVAGCAYIGSSACVLGRK